ncbi:MAG: GYD domain-containing protein [Dehalococcoidia bacterium]|nr:GYD domain-containing protein [Dehalococcoidia bacterium]
MPIFVALGKATETGIRNLEAFAVRHDRAVQRAEAAGGKVLASYALLGHYDYLVILDCPDERTAMYILTREAAGGNVRYETLMAMPMKDFTTLIQF